MRSKGPMLAATKKTVAVITFQVFIFDTTRNFNYSRFIILDMIPERTYEILSVSVSRVL